MLVVADSSPLIALVNIGHITVLPTLFGRVLIPPEVVNELGSPARPPAIRAFAAARPDWLEQRAPKAIDPIPMLHAGEVAAIALARELKADLLLIDEARGRKAAAERHINLTGTVGVLEMAATRGLLDLADAFKKLKQTDFWISPLLLDERLKRFVNAKSS
jgi:predicted nucleic acid-binding protein